MAKSFIDERRKKRGHDISNGAVIPKQTPNMFTKGHKDAKPHPSRKKKT